MYLKYIKDHNQWNLDENVIKHLAKPDISGFFDALLFVHMSIYYMGISSDCIIYVGGYHYVIRKWRTY